MASTANLLIIDSIYHKFTSRIILIIDTVYNINKKIVYAFLAYKMYYNSIYSKNQLILISLNHMVNKKLNSEAYFVVCHSSIRLFPLCHVRTKLISLLRCVFAWPNILHSISRMLTNFSITPPFFKDFLLAFYTYLYWYIVSSSIFMFLHTKLSLPFGLFNVVFGFFLFFPHRK